MLHYVTHNTRLNPQLHNTCTIVLPWRKFCYNNLFFKGPWVTYFWTCKMSSFIFNNILIVSHVPFKTHIHIIDQVLQRLQQKNLTSNATKLEWAKKKVKYLVFLLSQDGIRPQETKIHDILRMQTPQNAKYERQFSGLINFYKGTWPYWSHLIKPLQT